MLQLKNLSEKILLWVLIGPVFLLAALCVGLVKAPGALGMVLPLTMMLGVLFCWKWQAKGLVASLALLLVNAFIFESGSFPGASFWFIGLIASLALSLFITSLAFHEVSYIVQKTEEDTARYLEDYLRVEEKLKEQDVAFDKEKRSFNEKYDEAEVYVRSQKEDLVSTKNVLALMKSEVDELSKRELALKGKLLLAREGGAQKEVILEREAVHTNRFNEEPKIQVEREAFVKMRASSSAKSQGLSQTIMRKVLISKPSVYRLPALQGRVAAFIASHNKVGTWVVTKDKVKSCRSNLFNQELGIPMLKLWAKEMLSKEKASFLQNDLVLKTEEVQTLWSEIAQVKKEKESIEQVLRDLSEEKGELLDQVKELEHKASENEEWESLAKESLNELNKVRSDAYQASLLDDEGGGNKLTLFHRMTGFLSEEVKRLKRNNDLYKQLRKQFEDKTEVLDRTREEMFQMETALLTKEITEEEVKRAESNNVTRLENEIIELVHEQTYMEKEIEHLRDIVSELLTVEQQAS